MHVQIAGALPLFIAEVAVPVETIAARDTPVDV